MALFWREQWRVSGRYLLFNWFLFREMHLLKNNGILLIRDFEFSVMSKCASLLHAFSPQCFKKVSVFDLCYKGYL